MKRICAAAVLCASAGIAQAQEAPELPAFLAGCWESRECTTLVQEQWMAPAGGLMLGMARTLRDGRVVNHEHLRIETTQQGLDYVALPSKQALTRFALVKQGPGQAEFANPAHDFPTTVRYTALAAGELLAQIEGPAQGRHRVIDFRYRRTACP